MKKVRFGVIGMGNMGTGHSIFLSEGKVENGILAAICDNDPQKLERAKRADNILKVPAFSCAEELMDSGFVDAVVVSVPHYFHPELCIKALKRNLNVICEKPAGVYTKQVKEMNSAAAESKGLFGMMFNQRMNCLYRKMRDMIAGGEVGTLKRVSWLITDWYRSQSYYDSGDWRATWSGEGGGVLFNQAPHQLDLLQWVTGMMPSRVHAFCHFGKWHDIEVEDDVTAYLEFPCGATGTFVTSTADAPGTNRFEVLGTGGKLVCENNALEFFKLDTDERIFNRDYKGGFGDPPFKKVPIVTDGNNPQHIGILNNFANAVLGLEPLFVDGREGINGVILMDAMLLSAWLGRAVDLPFDDDLYLSELNKRVEASRRKKGTGTVLDTNGTYGK